MIIWSGRGILTPLIIIVVNALFIFTLPQPIVAYSLALGLLVSGIINWILGKKWNDKEGRILVDESSGERIEFKPNHTLFWIKMQYWGVLLGAVGLVLFVIQMVG